MDFVNVGGYCLIYAFKDGSPPTEKDIEHMVRNSRYPLSGHMFRGNATTFGHALEVVNAAIPDAKIHDKFEAAQLLSILDALVQIRDHGIDVNGRGLTTAVLWESQNLNARGAMCLLAVTWAPPRSTRGLPGLN
jgi:hypothetical protein